MTTLEIPHVLDLTRSGERGLLQPTNSVCHILNGASVLMSLSVYALDNIEHSGELVEECRGKYVEISSPHPVVANIVAEQTTIEGPESGPDT